MGFVSACGSAGVSEEVRERSGGIAHLKRNFSGGTNCHAGPWKPSKNTVLEIDYEEPRHKEYGSSYDQRLGLGNFRSVLAISPLYRLWGGFLQCCLRINKGRFIFIRLVRESSQESSTSNDRPCMPGSSTLMEGLRPEQPGQSKMVSSRCR